MRPASTLRLLLCTAALAGLLPGSARALQETPNEGAWLGVSIQDLDAPLREHFPTSPPEGGVLVNRVLPDSPADRAGLRQSDVLLELDGTPLQNAEQLRQQISRARPGTELRLLVLRDGERLELTARLTAKPESTPGLGQELYEWLETPWERWFLLSHEGGLGARMADLNASLAEYFPGTSGQGVLVLQVCEDSPAEKAGLRPGDVLVAAQGQTIADLGDLRHELRQADAQHASLELVRKGERTSVQIELRSGQECWKGPGHSFFHLRPGHRSFRLQRPKIPPVDEPGPSSAEPREHESAPLRDEVRSLRQHTEQLKSALQQLRTEIDELRREMSSRSSAATPPTAPPSNLEFPQQDQPPTGAPPPAEPPPR